MPQENSQQCNPLLRAGAEYVRQLDESKRGFRPKSYFGEKRPDFDTASSSVKVLAYYLPQFHPIKENNEWWGKGFTEWTNVTSARAHFVGHYQPHLPSDLGFYDLRNDKTIIDQVDLAKMYGISGFIFYYYWFNSQRVLEEPLNIFIKQKDNGFPFALCWANENWTRRWDGQEAEILLRQTYSPESARALIEDIADVLTDPRYIHIDGRPMFCVYRAAQIPNIDETVACWRATARALTGKDLFLVSALTFSASRDPRSYGFDAGIQFPPHGAPGPSIAERLETFRDDYKGMVYDYDAMARHACDFLRECPFPVIPSVFPSWDNTPRRGENASVFFGSSPDAYGKWLAEAAYYASRRPVFDKSFVTVNAWNEWGEGAHLEPDRRFGHAFLRVTADILRPYVEDVRSAYRPDSFDPTATIDGLKGPSETSRLAIIIHAYSSDRLKDIIKSIPADYYRDTFITTNDDVDETVLASIAECSCDINILFFPNRGRDIRPFLGALKVIRSRGRPYFLKIHTGASVHAADGANRGAEPTQTLLGALRRNAIERFLDSEPGVGLIGPQGHVTSASNPAGSPANMQWIRKLGEHLGVPVERADFPFVAGAIFAGRVEVFDRLIDDPWLPSMFEDELGRLDGTLAQAMERMFGLVCEAMNKEIVSVGIVDDRVRFSQGWPANDLPLAAVDSPIRLDRSVCVNQDAYRPLVSVIVPNYNHKRFLTERLNSIINQTYTNFEIILLDDSSTDGSQDLLREFQRRRPGMTRLILNDRRSGSVFAQWRKGIDHANGELIWVCESDDSCERDFLANIVPHFNDLSVNLAFGRTQYINDVGEVYHDLDSYREAAEGGIWDETLGRPAHEWFCRGFGASNVIPNVGGAVWRNQDLSNAVWEEAITAKIVADWFIYCQVAGGGRIVYEKKAVSYFRQHGANTSASREEWYYREHMWIILTLRRVWGIPPRTVEKFHQNLLQQYRRFNSDNDPEGFNRLFDIGLVYKTKRVKPHILMAMFGFQVGGGEVFPIQLANSLRRAGLLVSMLVVDRTHANQGILKSLDRGIAVYSSEYVAEIGIDRFLSDAGVSLIHSHVVSVDLFFFNQQRRRTRRPYIVTLHGSYEASNLKEDELAPILEGVTFWVYLTEKNLEPLRKGGLDERRIAKLGNALPADSRPFPMTREALEIPEDAVVFTLVARGIREKGWEAAIEAFAGLHGGNTQRAVRLLLCGEGEEVERLRAIHEKTPNIAFLGYQSHVGGLLRMSDCVLLPTRYAGESFPLVLIQAMQSGAPMIATRIGEIETMIHRGDKKAGILIEPEDNDEQFVLGLVTAMREMLNDEKRKRYAATSAEFGLRYDMDELTRNYVNLYDRLLGRGVDALDKLENAPSP